MNEDELTKAITEQQSFRPVRVHLSNGATFDVEHPDTILIGPRTSDILYQRASHLIANIHINDIEPMVTAER